MTRRCKICYIVKVIWNPEDIMRWTKNYAVAAIAVGLGSIVSVASLKAEPIVIKYEGRNGESYKPGKKLAPNAKISLKAGEILTVLDERGTRILRGPGTFSSSSSAASTVSNTSLAALIKTSSVRRARTGAVRGEAVPTQQGGSPNLWFVDVGKSGKICVADFENLQLWRADAEAPRQIIATNVATGNSASTRFGKGQTTAKWPSSLIPLDGANYTLGTAGEQQKTSVRLVKVAMTGEERLDSMASKLLEQGCQTQSELLAATFVQADAGPIGGE
jgi:hypothetical protein